MRLKDPVKNPANRKLGSKTCAHSRFGASAAPEITIYPCQRGQCTPDTCHVCWSKSHRLQSRRRLAASSSCPFVLGSDFAGVSSSPGERWHSHHMATEFSAWVYSWFIRRVHLSRAGMSFRSAMTYPSSKAFGDLIAAPWSPSHGPSTALASSCHRAVLAVAAPHLHVADHGGHARTHAVHMASFRGAHVIAIPAMPLLLAACCQGCAPSGAVIARCSSQDGVDAPRAE